MTTSNDDQQFDQCKCSFMHGIISYTLAHSFVRLYSSATYGSIHLISETLRIENHTLLSRSPECNSQNLRVVYTFKHSVESLSLALKRALMPGLLLLFRNQRKRNSLVFYDAPEDRSLRESVPSDRLSEKTNVPFCPHIV